VSVGEAFDMGDKATAKAMSVAYRTCLLQALTIPTDDPDPDESSYEQAPAAPVWNAGMVKAALVELVGTKDMAKAAWEYGNGDALTEWSPAVAQRLADDYMSRPIEGEGPS
jgi:hypothetical protein